MKKISKKELIIFVLVFSLAILILFLNKNRINLEELNINDLGFSISNIEDFSIEKLYNNEYSKTSNILLSKDNEFIKIHIFNNKSKQESIVIINEVRSVIDDLFSQKVSPYTGVITNEIICPEEFHPKIENIEIDNYKTSYYFIYSTERFTYGVCSRDLIKYNSILTFVYCDKTKRLYQIELFTPINKSNNSSLETIKSFKCK